MSISVEVHNQIVAAKSTQAQRLFLNYHRLKEIPPELLELDKLEGIFLKYNCLVKLPSQIYKLKSLVELYLHSNNLQSLPDEIGQLYCLKSLNISSNHLEILPSTIGDLANLQDLHLAFNDLTHLPESLAKLKCLKNLNFMNNNIVLLPWQLCFCEKLEILLADGNKIRWIPRQFTDLKQLKELSVSRNRLITIPQDIDNMSSLETILLDSNSNLCALPVTVFRLKNLTTLGINRCGTQGLNEIYNLDLRAGYQDITFIGNQVLSVCPLLELSLRSVYKLFNSNLRHPSEHVLPRNLLALLSSPSGHCYSCKQPFFVGLFGLTTDLKTAMKLTGQSQFDDPTAKLPMIFASCSLKCLNGIEDQLRYVR